MRLLLIAIVAFLMPVTPSYAQQAVLQVGCAPIGVIENGLVERYGEKMISRGVGDRGLLFHLWKNDETGSWTILFTDADTGMTCMVAGGDDWQSTRESY